MVKVRRYDIDWIRVIVFDILIIYHVGMFFVPWGWHIKNDEIIDWMRLPMGFTNQWRLPILFMVSGIGTRYALSFRSSKQYISERFKRLFIPLLAGILIVIPPQVYIERLVDGDTTKTFFEWFPEFFSGVYPSGNFSWHHLWFLPYLLLFSLIATPLFMRWRKEDNRLIKWLAAKLERSAYYIYLFCIPLVFVEAFMEPLFPINHALVGDWYALVLYFIFFLAGFMLISTGDVFWKSVQKIRYFSLVLGLICFPLLLWFWFNVDSSVFIPILKILNMWSWMVVIFGFSAKYLNKEGKVVKYRNRAVYPFYILHQTITVIIGYYLINADIHYGVKFVIMLVGTFGITWLLYELIIRRVPILKPLFGLKPN
ncbi:MAG: acyltransferase family protein [Flavobacteriaceae bacterium]|nr:acyltransferase family protein [Bacteroidia bacterium]NNK86952.1 acyltransferase family protein [Flavobacteriaceae bacterium]